MFYFSSATLIIGLLGSAYLFLEYLRHGEKWPFTVFWAIGLFLLYWFQVPMILFQAAVGFTLTDFNPFFSFAFPISFVGSLLIYVGLLSVTRPPSAKRNTVFVVWVALAAILFFFYFANRQTITNYSSTFIFILGFFLPLYGLSLYEIWRWRRKTDWLKSVACHYGIAILAAVFIVKILESVYAMNRVLQLPPAFWFLAVANSPALFIMQGLGTLLLLAGFFLVHRSCCGIANSAN